MEEYRIIKPYWTKRLEGKMFDEIYFRNGYAPDCPSLRVECLGIEKNNTHYVIKLGKILTINNANRVNKVPSNVFCKRCNKWEKWCVCKGVSNGSI